VTTSREKEGWQRRVSAEKTDYSRRLDHDLRAIDYID